MAADAAPLDGLGVLVTRPAHQADSLCSLIEGLGASVYRFPVLEIRSPVDRAPLENIGTRLAAYDWAVFVSANAVQRALDTILSQRPWPASTRIAVIGQRSAAELQRFGLSADLCPQQRFDSEGLLALPPMQHVAGQRFVIFRGDGGREYLAETLRARGAEVDYVAAYRRVRPDSDPVPLLQQWRAGAIQVVIVNSAESLRSLAAMLGDAGADLLRHTQLLVVSPRMLAQARDLGIASEPIVAASAMDNAVVAALVDWRTACLQ